tara:strand:- start:261 stop:536 length:276 start_codon:yes stop_codon:yes gene_type:complete
LRTVQEVDVSEGKTGSVSVPTSTTRVLLTCNLGATLGVYVAVRENDLENNNRFLLHPNKTVNLSPYVGSNQLFFKSLDGVSPDQFVYVAIA